MDGVIIILQLFLCVIAGFTAYGEYEEGNDPLGVFFFGACSFIMGFVFLDNFF